MVKVIEHKSLDNRGGGHRPSPNSAVGHFHSNWVSESELSSNGEPLGTLYFDKRGVVFCPKENSSHFHIDIWDEVEELISNLKNGMFEVK